MDKKCPKCGKVNTNNFDFCVYCGTKFDEYKQEQNNIKLNIIETNNSNFNTNNDSNNNKTYTKNHSNNQNNFEDLYNLKPQKTHNIAILLGYVFSILGGLLGLIIAIYLITRKDQRAKKHGKIQIGIFAIYFIILGIFLATGHLNMDQLLNPMNMTNMTNTSNLSSLMKL